MNRLLKAIKNPDMLALYLLGKPYISRLFSDESFLKMKYRLIMGKKLDLDNPKTFNEKLQWLKIHDRKPEYTMMVDKYAVREYIAEKLGEEYLIPLLGVWDDPDEIDFDALPDKFVLKCNHNSGTGMCICRDKSKLDTEKVKKDLRKGLREDYYLTGREWPYKNVKRKIIAENYMVDESGVELKDYKIFCFNGNPEYVEVDFNRHIQHKLNPYDFDWKPLNFCDSSKNDYSADIKKPAKIDDMYNIAKKLSSGIPFIRVDFYSIYDKLYVGELTLYPGCGYIKYDPAECDLKYGELLDLRGVK